MDSAARPIPSINPAAFPAATRANAAFIRTTSRGPPGAPSRIDSAIARFRSAFPPRIVSPGCGAMPKSPGATTIRSTTPFCTANTVEGPAIVSSSSPSEPFTTYARREPRRAKAPAIFSAAASDHVQPPESPLPPGFVSGPRKLNTVLIFSSARTGCTCRVAPWKAGVQGVSNSVAACPRRRSSERAPGGEKVAKASALVGPKASRATRRPIVEILERNRAVAPVGERERRFSANPDRLRSCTRPRTVARMKPLVPGATV